LDTSDERVTRVAKRRKVGNLLGLSLLSLLAQRPMYPYEMAQTLRSRGKERNFTINWGSLYTVVANLSKYGFIEEAGTVRAGRQPERTTYQITEPGLAELKDWLAELLRLPEDESGGFVTALSEAAILPPDEVIGLLSARLATLDRANAAQQDHLRVWIERLPRIFLIESEYQLAMRVAQSRWLRELLTELAEGTISGMDAWRGIHETGAIKVPPEFEERDARAKRGWDETPPDAAHDDTAHDDTAHDKGT
jgi:DNA-binding PadR family transcriptional regulator